MDTKDNEIRILLQTALSISSNLRGIDCDRRQSELSGLFMKQVLHCYTFFNIINPQPNSKLSSSEAVFYDFSSANIIVRSVFETYVNMLTLYDFTNSNTENVKEFYLDLWDLHALCERRRISKVFQGSDFLNNLNTNRKEKLDDNEKSINYFCKKILDNPFLKQLDKPEQNSIKSKLMNSANGYLHWQKESIETRAEKYGISKSIIDYLYKYTSAYVHSTSLANMQMLAPQNEEEYLFMLEVPKNFIIIFLSQTINKYNDVIDIQKYLTKDVVGIINKYDDIARRPLK